MRPRPFREWLAAAIARLLHLALIALLTAAWAVWESRKLFSRPFSLLRVVVGLVVNAAMVAREIVRLGAWVTDDRDISFEDFNRELRAKRQAAAR